MVAQPSNLPNECKRAQSFVRNCRESDKFSDDGNQFSQPIPLSYLDHHQKDIVPSSESEFIGLDKVLKCLALCVSLAVLRPNKNHTILFRSR